MQTLWLFTLVTMVYSVPLEKMALEDSGEKLSYEVEYYDDVEEIDNLNEEPRNSSEMILIPLARTNVTAIMEEIAFDRINQTSFKEENGTKEITDSEILQVLLSLADESLGPNFDTPSNNTKKEEILFVEKRTVGSEETTESVSFASRTENDLFDVMPPWEQNMDQDSDPTLKADDFSQTDNQTPCTIEFEMQTRGEGCEEGATEKVCSPIEVEICVDICDSNPAPGVVLPEKKCTEINVTECVDVPKEECFEVDQIEDLAVKEECETTMAQECKLVNKTQCQAEAEKICEDVEQQVEVSQNVCQDLLTERCNMGLKNVCVDIQEMHPAEKTDCGLKPVQVCHEPEEICKDSANCITLTQTRCFTVLKDTCLQKEPEAAGPKQQKCELVPFKTDCNSVNEKSCKEVQTFEPKIVPVCKEVTVEKCGPFQVTECNLVPKTVCSVIKKVPLPKITECETVLVAKCEIVVKQDCQILPEIPESEEPKCKNVCSFVNEFSCEVQKKNCSETQVEVQVCPEDSTRSAFPEF